jgi:hypothetical protein
VRERPQALVVAKAGRSRRNALWPVMTFTESQIVEILKEGGNDQEGQH